MEKGINHERLRLLIIAVAIVAVSSIAIIETEPRVSAHTDQPLVSRTDPVSYTKLILQQWTVHWQ